MKRIGFGPRQMWVQIVNICPWMSYVISILSKNSCPIYKLGYYEDKVKIDIEGAHHSVKYLALSRYSTNDSCPYYVELFL